MAKPISVLMTTEGTYPFFEGGVSTWCDVLIREMPDIQFELLSMVAQPGLKPRYTLPTNVKHCAAMPLWGTGGVNELRSEIGTRKLHRMRSGINDSVMKSDFEKPFKMLLKGLLEDKPDFFKLKEALRILVRFFQKHDYDKVFRHPLTWEIFKNQIDDISPILKEQFPEAWPPSLSDVIEALRLLYRWLTPLALPVPQADLVHASAAGLSSLPGIIAKLEHGTPLLLTEHGVYLRERLLYWAKEDLKPFIKFFLGRVTHRLVELSYEMSDIIAPVANWNARWEQHLGADVERIRPIANGIDPNRFSPQPMPDRSVPTLVWVGRIDPLKDVVTLIEAMALVKKAIPNVSLLIYGKAPVGNEAYNQLCLDRQQELGLEETIKFMGFAQSPEHAYAKGHVVVLSSISEALPFSLIEAMFCGRPVVGTDVGGVPEVVGKAGLVVMPRDHKAMAEACIELLSDLSHCEVLGERAREHALEKFTLKRCIDSYAETYQQLALQKHKVAEMPTVDNRGSEKKLKGFAFPKLAFNGVFNSLSVNLKED
ncbi:MAG: GT4 family glycosyltransferase PelF [Chloroflexi bacterium]|uniref:GT4 family glycosyltransferase PelF n=1 Tax=Candidatus Chlorohelix allophototropha TaxID=3003348 RepID=A0A8T7M740_9CHLR|nr:GT4 family glycosyltransferase PelF [Chloroflexota bacterium]WJW69870.1 GT4 family glycosyltransferase PelF [Chloroflexota bacterium L227-S17]